MVEPSPSREPSSSKERSGEEWNGEHLVLSHFTLDRNHDIADRVRVAAEGGYDGMGLYLGNFVALRDADRLGELDDLLAEYELPLCDIEVLRGWGTVGLADESYAAMEDAAWAMAERYGCRYIQAIGPVGDDLGEAGAAFGALCDRAAEHGLVVGLEFLPFTPNVFDADAGRRIVEEADRPNGGLCVDIWHHTRGSNDIEQLRQLSAEHVTGIQMNDGPLKPTDPTDYVQDCLRYRVPPGEGEMDAVGFVTELLRIGADVPWQLEVCNDDVWDKPGEPALAHARAAADGMRSVLAQAQANLGT
jgi:sugar phosphate isomerase/epimerase